MTRIFRWLVIGLWFPCLLVSGWWLAGEMSPNPFFTPPQEIVSSLGTLLQGSFVEMYVLPTLGLIFSGYGLGATAGVVLGTIVGMHGRTLEIVGPIVVFIRSIPSAARVSVLLGIFGIGTQSLILAVALSATFHVAMVTMSGVARVPATTIETAKLLRLSWMRALFLVRIPAASGDILTGLQSSLQVSILVSVLVETISSGRGIGAFTIQSLSAMRISHMWVSVLILGTLGLVLNEFFHILERRMAPWYFLNTIGRGE